MNLIPISPDAEIALEDANRRVQNAGSKLPYPLVMELSRSQHKEVRAMLCSVVFERPGTIQGFEDRWHAAFDLCYAFLLECLVQDYSSEYCLSKFESAEHIQILFTKLFQLKANDELIQMRDGLASAYKLHDDEPFRDAIITGILEHLFVDPAIVQFFGPWKHDPLLVSFFDEAKRLGESWKEHITKHTKPGHKSK